MIVIIISDVIIIVVIIVIVLNIFIVIVISRVICSRAQPAIFTLTRVDENMERIGRNVTEQHGQTPAHR